MTLVTPRRLATIALVLSLGLMIAFGVLLSRPIPVPIPPAVYLGVLAAATLVAALVLARVPEPHPAFTIGQPAPDFTLPDAAGRPVKLADFRGQKPVVLVFYRG